MNEGPILPDPRDAARQPAGAGASTPPACDRAAPTRDSTRPFAPKAVTPEDADVLGELPEGTRVGKYVLLEPLGGGGMGFVYLAENPDLRCPVALKVLRAGELAGPEELRRFARECEALARFRHPHIVTVHDAGHDRGRPFLVMEYLAGGNLSNNLARFQVDARAAVALIEKVARAVGQLHAAGLLHRDLKPANVLLDEQGEPRVSDFGLVKLFEADEALTRTEQQPGTPPYMAPEQIDSAAGPTGPATDVWALGVMLYELLLTRRPFTAGHRSGLFRRIATADPDRPRALRPGFDAELEAVLLRCLEKDPSRRYATAAELADELARWLAGGPTRARPEGRLRRLRRAARRRPWLTASVLLLAALSLAAPVVAYFADPDRPLRAVRARFAAGQASTLIGEHGRPAWSAWAIEADGRSFLDREGGFVVQARELALLELLPQAPPAPFRLRADVRHEQGDWHGCVGLFAAHRAASRTPETPRLFLCFAYNDVIDLEALANARIPKQANGALRQTLGGNPASLNAWLYAQRGTEAVVDVRDHLIPSAVFTPAGQNGGPWRTLVIDVHADHAVASLSGVPTGPLGFKAVNEKLATQVVTLLARDAARYGLLADVDPHLDRSGSLGLLVHRGNAAFRNVVLEPLPK